MSWRGFLGRNTRHVRFLLDAEEMHAGGRCYGAALWVGKNDTAVHDMNPGFRVGARAYPGLARPHMVVHYDFNKEYWFPIAGKTEEEIDGVLRRAVAFGERVPKAKYPGAVKFALPPVSH